MCGRYTLTIDRDAVRVLFGAHWITDQAAADWKPRYNVAPESRVPVIVGDRGSGKIFRTIRFMKWGLVPSWAADESVSGRLTNARAETVNEKPLFRDSFRRRRALIPADGFFEWDKFKTPYRAILAGGAPHAYAAVWDCWRSPGGAELESFAIVTCEATPSLQAVHHRMPVIVEAADYDNWLDPENQDVLGLKRLVLREPRDTVRAYAVSKLMNSARNDDPSCIVADAAITEAEICTHKPPSVDDSQMTFGWGG